MNSHKSPLEYWLGELSAEAAALDGVWDPGFDGGRHIVVSKLGPFRKVYERPQHFKPWFFHAVYPLPIQDWQMTDRISLYGGFCSIDTVLAIRFQASVAFAQANADVLPTLNEHIKANFEGLIRDAVAKEMQQLDDGVWVDSGLSAVEKRLQTAINETLAVQHIHCRALCSMQATFADIDSTPLDGRFARKDIYLKILQKNFEVRERQQQERFRQEQALEQQRLEQQQWLIEQKNSEEAIKRESQAQMAENIKRGLEDKEQQLAEQLQIEERLHREQLKHLKRLQAIEEEVDQEQQRQKQLKQFELERQLQEERLEHQRKLKEQQLAAEIEQFSKEQTTWIDANDRFRIEKIRREERIKELENETEFKLQQAKLLEEQKLQERLQEEKLRHENRLKEMELQMQIEEQKKRYEATQHVDEYLRHDIELLILEQHRGELIQAIRSNKQAPELLPGLPESLRDGGI